MADRDDIDARDGVEVALAVDVPVIHAVGAGHHQRLLRPFRHLVADEDLAKEFLLRGFIGVDQVGEDVGGHCCLIRGEGHHLRPPLSPQKTTAVAAYNIATRTRSSISTHSETVCCPPAYGPCVIAGIRASAQKLLPSSTNGLGPSGSGEPALER